jgi:hypothetical protein
MPGWMPFLAFALAGGAFNCVLEDQGWKTKRVAPKMYAGVILRRFNGVTT